MKRIGAIFVLAFSLLVYAQQTDTPLEPAETVAAFVEHVNAGENEAARALFGEEGSVAYGLDGAPMVGTDLESWLTSDLFDVNGQIEVDSFSGRR